MAARRHENQTVLHAGAALNRADSAMVLLHGRGAPASDILSLHYELDQPSMAFLAPSALDNSWYPYSFLAPMANNQPYLDSALHVISLILEELSKEKIPLAKTILLGFSQGACLTLEYAARNSNRYGGIVALSGGLIGPPETPRDYAGSFASTPAYFGCSDIDPHIPVERVNESAVVYEKMGADVTKQIFTGGGHTVFPEEIAYIRELVRTVTA